MKLSFRSRITVTALITACAVFIADARPVGASEIYAGATGLVKDAIEVIRSDDDKPAGSEETEVTFNMEIESTVERDLSGTILEGIYIDDINLSGKTYDEAVRLVKEKVRSMADAEITLNSIGDNIIF